MTNENRIDMIPPENHITSRKIYNTTMGVEYDPIGKTIKYVTPQVIEAYDPPLQPVATGPSYRDFIDFLR